jgi:hypothetical protein
MSQKEFQRVKVIENAAGGRSVLGEESPAGRPGPNPRSSRPKSAQRAK